MNTNDRIYTEKIYIQYCQNIDCREVAGHRFFLKNKTVHVCGACLGELKEDYGFEFINKESREFKLDIRNRQFVFGEQLFKSSDRIQIPGGFKRKNLSFGKSPKSKEKYASKNKSEYTIVWDRIYCFLALKYGVRKEIISFYKEILIHILFEDEIYIFTSMELPLYRVGKGNRCNYSFGHIISDFIKL